VAGSQPLDARAEVTPGEAAAVTNTANPLLNKNVLIDRAFTSLADFVDHVVNGGSSSAAAPTASASAKRQFTKEDFELLKRAGLGGLAEDTIGLAKSAGFSALTTGLEDVAKDVFEGGSSTAAAPAASQAPARREFTEEDFDLLKRAGLGGLAGDAIGLAKSAGLSAVTAGLEDIAKDVFEGSSSTAAAPAATPAAARREIVSDDELTKRAIVGLLEKLASKREVDKRLTLPSSLGTAIKDVFEGGFKAAVSKIYLPRTGIKCLRQYHAGQKGCCRWCWQWNRCWRC
jgi:hypothetical protein